jgi:hypothetical protein
MLLRQLPTNKLPLPPLPPFKISFWLVAISAPGFSRCESFRKRLLSSLAR